MQFPLMIHLPISNNHEYDAVITALQSAATEPNSTIAIHLTKVIDRIKVTETGDIPRDLPEAKLLVDGRKVVEGFRADMEELFEQEINSHRASITLLARPPGSLEYKQVRQRLIPIT